MMEIPQRLVFVFLIFCQDRPKYFVALKTIAKWNCHFPPNDFPSSSWPVFASIPNQQLDLPCSRWDPCSSFPFPDGPVSPSANQGTLGSFEVAPGAPGWCHQHLGTSCPSWRRFQRVQVMLLTSVPEFLPLLPSNQRGWSHIPEHPSPSSQSSASSASLRFLWAGEQGRAGYPWALGPIRNNSLELIGFKWNRLRSQPVAI